MLTLADVRHRTGTHWRVVEPPVSFFSMIEEEHYRQVAIALGRRVYR